MKQVMRDAGIQVVPYLWFYDTEFLNNKEEIELKINELGYPVIIKPATLGSSVGIGIAKNSNELEVKVNEAMEYDAKIVVEKVISNLIEVNVSVEGNYEYQEVSAIEEVISANEILTYSDKYMGKGKSKGKGMQSTNRVIPARIKKKEEDTVKDLALKVFKILNLGGV